MRGVDDGGRRRAALLTGALAALLAWGALVALAVAEGRQVRVGDGSWGLLALWGLGAVASLYAAAMLALRSRRAPEPSHEPRQPPRHRG